MHSLSLSWAKILQAEVPTCRLRKATETEAGNSLNEYKFFIWNVFYVYSSHKLNMEGVDIKN